MAQVRVFHICVVICFSSCGDEVKIVVVEQPTEPVEGEEWAAPSAYDDGGDSTAHQAADGGAGNAEEEREDGPSLLPPGCGPSECPALKSFMCAADGQTPLICGPRMGEPEDCVSVWQDLGFVCPPGTVCTVSADEREFECVVEGVAPVCSPCGNDDDCPPEAPRCLVWTTNMAISWCSGPCGSRANCPPDSSCFSSPAVTSVCVPTAWRDCRYGDVWDVDSCGNAISMAEECGAVLCDDGACP